LSANPRGWPGIAWTPDRAILGRFGHRCFNRANNGQKHATANTARGELADDRADIKAARTASRHTARAKHTKDLTAKAATKNAHDGISNSSEALVLQNPTRHVAANCTGNQTDNQL
jgi:hypothetical protein